MAPQLSDPLPPVLTGEYRPPHCRVRGGSRASTFQPANVALWRIVADLEPGAEIEWGTAHGDEGMYVLDGRLEHAGTGADQGSVVIVEAGAPGIVQATEPTRVLHVGTAHGTQPAGGPLGPAATDGRNIHVVPAGQTRVIGPDPRDGVSYFSDGSCTTCRIAMFEVYGYSPPGETYATGSHLHTEDEIIHVLEGQLEFGRRCVTPGMSIAVPRDQRYGFRARGTFRFINYRPDVAYFVGAPKSPPQLETVDEILALYPSLAGRAERASAAGPELGG